MAVPNFLISATKVVPCSLASAKVVIYFHLNLTRGNIFEFLQSPVHALLARPWLPSLLDTSFSIDIPEIISHSAGIPKTFFFAGPPDNQPLNCHQRSFHQSAVQNPSSQPVFQRLSLQLALQMLSALPPLQTLPTLPGYLDVSRSASFPEPSLSASSLEASRSASSPTVSLPESLHTAGLPESLLAADPTDALHTLGLGLTLSASSQAASLSANSSEDPSSAGYPNVARAQEAYHCVGSPDARGPILCPGLQLCRLRPESLHC